MQAALELYDQICRITDGGGRCAFGLVVFTQGSTPQKVGSIAVIDDAGNQWGTLGGGLVEAQALERMRQTLDRGHAEVVELRLDDSYSREAGPICGGVMRVLVGAANAGLSAAYSAALEARRSARRGVLVTSLFDGVAGARWVAENNGSAPANGFDAQVFRDCLKTERAQWVETGLEGPCFIQPIVSPPRLLVVGGGHVGQEVVFQAVRLGFAVTVIDDRPEFADAALFPHEVVAMHGSIGELVKAFPKGNDAYVVLVSKGHRPDAEALESCIHDSVAFLGMIGSERKIRLLRRDFLERGIATAEEWDRVVAPIGADIGAISVPEIGVSIAAQLVAVRRKGMPLDAGLRLRPRSERAGIPRQSP